MKVSAIYRILFFLFVGCTLGFASGAYITTKVILKNMPPTQEISIGKQKIKGRGNTLESAITPTLETTDNSTRRERRKLRK